MAFNRYLIEAELALRMITMRELAEDALDEGIDGPALRRLAAVDEATAYEEEVILPRAMQEMGLRAIEATEAARRYLIHFGKEILESGADPLPRLSEIENLWMLAGHPEDFWNLGTLHDAMWVWRSSGDSEDEIRVKIRKALRSEIDAMKNKSD